MAKRVEGADENYIGFAQLPVLHTLQQHIRTDEALIIPDPQRKNRYIFCFQGTVYVRKLLQNQLRIFKQLCYDIMKQSFNYLFPVFGDGSHLFACVF